MTRQFLVALCVVAAILAPLAVAHAVIVTIVVAVSAPERVSIRAAENDAPVCASPSSPLPPARAPSLLAA